MVGTFGPIGEGGVFPGLSGCASGDGLLAGGGISGPGAGAGSWVEDVAGGERSLDALQRLGGDGLRVPAGRADAPDAAAAGTAGSYSPPSAAASAAAAGAAAGGKGAGSSCPPPEPKMTTREAEAEDWQPWRRID